MTIITYILNCSFSNVIIFRQANHHRMDLNSQSQSYTSNWLDYALLVQNPIHCLRPHWSCVTGGLRERTVDLDGGKCTLEVKKG